jgi:hypothetical protein
VPIFTTVHDLFAVLTSVALFILVWWKVSSDNKLNKASIKLHNDAIVDLRMNKTDIAITTKLIETIDRIESELISHHTDFKMHRTDDSELRMSDLLASVNELAKENRADHQVIMNKLGRVERMDGKE